MPAAVALTREEALSRLAAIVGPDHAHLAADTLHVEPAGAEQISAVLRFANENALSVVPTGSGTKLAWGNPVAPHISLSLAPINTLREHAWQDLTCTVDAGCTWSAMQSELARHGQMVALDPLWPDRATVGGIVATNDSGALRIRYGALRDLIIGMTIVLADGTIAKSGGKVVKNVAGYDLHKLLTGSFGTLGVITQVNFRLHPIEHHTQAFTVCGDRDSLIDLMVRLHASTMQVSGLQLRGIHRESSDRLDIRIAARPECLARHEDELRSMAANLSIAPAADSVWQARQQLFDDAIARDGLVFKAAVLPTQMSALQREIAEWPGETLCVTQPTGIVTAAIFSGTMQSALHIDSLRDMLRPTGGSVVILRAPQTLRPAPDPWDCQSDALPLMREIKRRFDPNGILSPGRFVGGI
jgi:glycolate oxidase FAD binding subunit